MNANRFLRVAAFAALMGVLSLPAFAAATAPAADTVDITIFHLNDPHGHLEPYQLDGKSVGGYARVATVVDEARTGGKAARVFLVHAGDELSRGDELTRATKGAANVAILNLLKFDLWVPGNGDFYQTIDVVETRLAEAKFPILTANVKYHENGKPIGKPFIIEKAGPVRIAFLGLGIVTPTEAPSAADVLTAADPIEAAKQMVPDLRKQADVVVAVTHLGSPVDKRLAAAVPGIDLILGGHTHDTFPEGVPVKAPDGKSVLVCQAGEYMKFLGRVDLKMARDGAAWRVASITDTLVPLDDKIKLDPTVTALIARQAAAAPKPKPVKMPADVP